MAFLYEPTYITVTEIRENSTNSKLVAEQEILIKKLIVKAQIILDGYIWVIEPYVEWQDYKFPNSNNEIPKNIKQSTVYIVESIYTELLQNRDWIKSESWDWYSVAYTDNISSDKFEYITEATKNMLSEYGLWEWWLSAYKLNY